MSEKICPKADMSSTSRFLSAQSGSPDVATILVRAFLIVSCRRIKRELGKFLMKAHPACSTL